jgi:hypothetical protein
MSEAKQPTPPEESDRGLTAGLLRSGQIAGAITAIITVSVLIWTQVKPAGPAAPPGKLKVSVTSLTTLPNRTRLSYINDRPGQLQHKRAEYAAHGADEEEINQLLQKDGFTFESTIDVEAPPGRQLKLETVLYRMPAEERISQLSGILPEESFKTKAGEGGDKFEPNGWIEYPARPGKYLLEVDVVDQEGNSLGKGRRELDVPRT